MRIIGILAVVFAVLIFRDMAPRFDSGRIATIGEIARLVGCWMLIWVSIGFYNWCKSDRKDRHDNAA